MPPAVRSRHTATKARMEARTGVAQGDSTKASDPPSRKTRTSAERGLFACSCCGCVCCAKESGIMLPSSSNKRVEEEESAMDEEDSKGRSNCTEGRGILTRFKICNPIATATQDENPAKMAVLAMIAPMP
eukprot:3707111-Ditylum_brightwellii.AAC.1